MLTHAHKLNEVLKRGTLTILTPKQVAEAEVYYAQANEKALSNYPELKDDKYFMSRVGRPFVPEGYNLYRFVPNEDYPDEDSIDTPSKTAAYIVNLVYIGFSDVAETTTFVPKMEEKKKLLPIGTLVSSAQGRDIGVHVQRLARLYGWQTERILKPDELEYELMWIEAEGFLEDFVPVGYWLGVDEETNDYGVWSEEDGDY